MEVNVTQANHTESPSIIEIDKLIQEYERLNLSSKE